MPGDALHILIAAAICWINFVTIDLIFKLPLEGRRERRHGDRPADRGEGRGASMAGS